jgi:nucleotide-binding universal stress UspA family protein
MTPQRNTRNLLLAIDGSEHADSAIQFVCAMPLPENCQINIISVLVPRNAQYHVVLEKVLESAKEQLQKHNNIQVHSQLLTGYPAEQIIEFVEECKPDLAVLGARGLRSTLGILLGGVAQQVVEYASCPVLVVRSPFRNLQNALIAVDGSVHSKYALEYIQNCPLPEDVIFHILHVLPPEFTLDTLGQYWRMDMEFSPMFYTEQVQEQIKQQQIAEEEAGKKLLQEATESLENLQHPQKSDIRRGDAATEILEYAKAENIDLIISGSRGLSDFKGWLLGSVSRKLVHYANCSVLIVKIPSKH